MLGREGAVVPELGRGVGVGIAASMVRPRAGCGEVLLNWAARGLTCCYSGQCRKLVGLEWVMSRTGPSSSRALPPRPSSNRGMRVVHQARGMALPSRPRAAQAAG